MVARGGGGARGRGARAARRRLRARRVSPPPADARARGAGERRPDHGHLVLRAVPVVEDQGAGQGGRAGRCGHRRPRGQGQGGRLVAHQRGVQAVRRAPGEIACEFTCAPAMQNDTTRARARARERGGEARARARRGRGRAEGAAREDERRAAPAARAGGRARGEGGAGRRARGGGPACARVDYCGGASSRVYVETPKAIAVARRCAHAPCRSGLRSCAPAPSGAVERMALRQGVGRACGSAALARAPSTQRRGQAGRVLGFRWALPLALPYAPRAQWPRVSTCGYLQ